MTGTSQREISEWFDRGKSQGAKYMIVICDTFDWEDYPVFCLTKEEAILKKNDHGSMQKYMESYDLSAPKTEQLEAMRAHCL